MRWDLIRQRLGLIAFSGILTVAFLEGAARLYPYWLPPEVLLGLGPSLKLRLAHSHPTVFASIYPEWQRVFVLDSEIVYRLKSKQRVKIRPSLDHRPYWLITDSQGFRNPREYPQADVVAVGDSMTEGIGVPDEFTWVRRLEQMSGLLVANLGLRGNNLPMKIATIETYGLLKHPRVILFELVDDIGYPDETGQRHELLVPGYIQKIVRAREQELDSLRTPEGLLAAGLLSENPATLSGHQTGSLLNRLRYVTLSYSVTYAFIRTIFKSFRNLLHSVRAQQETRDQSEISRQSTLFSVSGRPVRIAIPPGTLEDIAFRSLPYLRKHPDWSRLQESLLKLREQSAAQEARLIIVLIQDPLPVYLPLIAGELPSSKTLSAALRSADAHPQLFASFCAEHDLIFIDTTPTLRAAAARGEQLCFPVDPHWNASGHRVIAQEIFRALDAKQLVSKPHGR